MLRVWWQSSAIPLKTKYDENPNRFTTQKPNPVTKLYKKKEDQPPTVGCGE